MSLPRKVVLTREQEETRLAAHAAFMKYAAFFAYFYYDQVEEYPTLGVPTAATDGKRHFFNPEYYSKLKPLERCFAKAHEVWHIIYKHPQRMKFYAQQGNLDGLPFIPALFNTAADYVINADLIASKIGTCNPNWLYDPRFTGDMLAEDVYKILYNELPKPPPQPPGRGKGPEGYPGPGGKPGDEKGPGGYPGPTTGSGDEPNDEPQPGEPTITGFKPKTYGGKNSPPDKVAEANNGMMDEILPPMTDPDTGKDDVASEMEFKEAIARAVDEVEKSHGTLPGSIKRVVKDILEPQVEWREKIRMEVTGKIGWRGETWERPNRRRLVLSAMGSGLPVYMPGRSRFGAELVVCVVDNSGSISERELSAFFGEMNGILSDCRPKNIMVIWCDAKIHRVAEASSLDELSDIRVKGSTGGGGTDFKPPFEYLSEKNLKPDTLVYLTDMEPGYGWPADPGYPTIWCATTDRVGPFGETVRVKV
jgi:predicted metal-dependent peptidase